MDRFPTRFESRPASPHAKVRATELAIRGVGIVLGGLQVAVAMRLAREPETGTLPRALPVSSCRETRSARTIARPSSPESSRRRPPRFMELVEPLRQRPSWRNNAGIELASVRVDETSRFKAAMSWFSGKCA